MRPRLVAGLKGLSIETIILPFSDHDTPIGYIGKKICPFLVLNSGETKTESTQLAAYLDTCSTQQVLSTTTLSTNCQTLITTYLKPIVALTAPQFISLPYKEFQTPADITPFQTREETFIGHPLTQTISKFDHYQTLITQFFTNAQLFLQSKPNTTLTMDEVALFAFFRNLSCVPNLTIPTTIQSFTTTLASKAHINIYTKLPN